MRSSKAKNLQTSHQWFMSGCRSDDKPFHFQIANAQTSLTYYPITTKRTGQATGLGLSLAYDIVKAQGGEIKVETKQGDGSEFIIRMPV